MSTQTAPRAGARVHVQKFGTFLSNMVMPNIGAIIAWGLITAFFIPVGWTPNEKIATIVGPGIYYLIPLLIAYTGGYNIYKIRGGVVGATATMGIIMATSSPLFNEVYAETGGSPMFLGAMIMGPFGGWAIMRLDRLWDGKIKPGFEMLVNNFSAGISAAIMAIGAMFILGPILRAVMEGLSNVVEFLVDNSLLPFTAIVIEPAKVLFLNNALNHGVLTPLGLDQAKQAGQSALFLLEANPGPGAGMLLAFMFFGKGVSKATAPGALVIQFFGGIHEVYFPYVLAKPKLLLALIAGGATGTLMNVMFDSGLVAPAAPGSIFAVYSSVAKGSVLGVTLCWSSALIVSFVVAALLLKLDRSEDDGDLAAAAAQMEANKGKSSSVSGMFAGSAKPAGPINSIIFACDAGMGSSAMGASVLRKKIQAAGYGEVSVKNLAISNLTDDVDLVVTHQDLTARAKERTPSATHVSVDNFMGSPRYDEIVEMVKASNGEGGGTAAADVADDGVDTDVLRDDAIVLNGSATSRDAAISEAGRLLVASGAVEESYVDAMHEREQSVSTHMGNLLAIPHGTNEAKSAIRRTAISFVRYPDGIDWNGKPAEFVVGIAGAGNDHLALLQKLAGVFVDQEQVERLRRAETAADVRAVLSGVKV
ncbi:PTS mannitol transporter subunit IICBA [Nocardioides currus]|uniref:Mannitol-specific phosphotransferase enzyme IIA component n=1 Tax=Nocardioides currus TaxID=2133958 RepID=A0A2R7YWG9_9ACTN|nr:PTS mannitol transporter subunit IICBA [Nocardioides currus]PUA80671.1 PTS mannose transporter subunit IIA [Nocardioides currus]